MRKITDEQAAALATALGVTELPENVAAKLRESSETDILALQAYVTSDVAKTMTQLAQRAMSRCGYCRGGSAGRDLCTACTQDLAILQSVAIELAVLSRMTVAAEAPGSRLSAARERRTENPDD